MSSLYWISALVIFASHFKQGKSEGVDSCDQSSNLAQIIDFSAHKTLKFDGSPRKTIRHLFFATSSFVHHFVAICEFKQELHSGNTQCRLKSSIFRPMLKFHRWLCNTMGQLFYATSSFVHHFIAICELRLELQSRNAQFRPKLAIFAPCDLEYQYHIRL